MTHPLIPRLFSIQSSHQESHDVFTMNVAIPPNETFDFQPGQFNMLYAFGVGEAAISISSDPQQNHFLSHTIRIVGAVTKQLEKLLAKKQVGIRGPFGTAWPIEQCKNHSILLLAGGIGIAPLRALIYSLLAHRENYQEITLIYGARTPHDLIYHNEIKNWEAKIKVILTVDNAPNDFTGHVGVVTRHIVRNISNPQHTIVMMCGPEIMMRFCYASLKNLNVPTKNIFISMERNMQCGIGLCGHCQWGPYFICKDGPVMNMAKIDPWFYKKEL